MKLENINAVITGGCSGLGKATAEIILKNGGSATILDTQKDKGEKLANEKGEKCNFLLTNVVDEENVKKNISWVEQNLGQINLAVYSASKGAIVSMTLPLAREL